MPGAHRFYGKADDVACQLILEMPGYIPEYCGLTREHSVHSGVCVHCGQPLEGFSTGDRIDVCRFCVPQFGTPPPNGKRRARCDRCEEGRLH